MYQFSLPMPYELENIDKLLDINNKIEKSRIKSLYFGLPSNCEFFTGFEQYRNSVLNKPWHYWKYLIKHSIDKGLDFIYLLNNPARLKIEEEIFSKQLDKLHSLLMELQKLGVNNLRITEKKLISYIEKHYSNFNIYASTSMELKSLLEYKNLLYINPNIKEIVPASDCIKNFELLKNLRKITPNIELEIMVNEGCLQGCPNRYGHASEITDKIINNNKDICLSNKFYTVNFCFKKERENPLYALVNSNTIFPWEIKEYSNLGINKFKLVGRDAFDYRIDNYINEYVLYLKGIDNIKHIENEPINKFSHHLVYNPILKKLSVKDIIKYLPNINHFKKYGHLCASRCGVECRYCYKCAEKIQRVFEKKQEAERKRTMPFCVMSK